MILALVILTTAEARDNQSYVGAHVTWSFGAEKPLGIGGELSNSFLLVDERTDDLHPEVGGVLGLETAQKGVSVRFSARAGVHDPESLSATAYEPGTFADGELGYRTGHEIQGMFYGGVVGHKLFRAGVHAGVKTKGSRAFFGSGLPLLSSDYPLQDPPPQFADTTHMPQ